MRILILIDHLGGRPPGPYLLKLIDKLSGYSKIVVITSECHQTIDLSKLQAIVKSPRAKLNPLRYKFLISTFGLHPSDLIWSLKSLRRFNKQRLGKFDLLLSIVGANSIYLLLFAKILKKTEGLKHAIYLLDAIPAPGWQDYKYFINGQKRYIKRFFAKTDALFTPNKEMLLYQLGTFKTKYDIIKDTIPHFCESRLIDYPNHYEGTNFFIYTGSIYGSRKPDYLLEAFDKLLETFPNSKLVFIGSWKNEKAFNSLKASTAVKIISLPFQEKLGSYYEMATALINIDADIPNDVFLSLKMSSYLTVNRIIINETGENSPSRNLFKGIKSIIHCDHDSTQLFEAMKFSISMKDSMDYEDRKPLIEELYIDNVAKRFNEALRRLYVEI